MNIYVGNLAYGMTEDELQQLFSEYGNVASTNIIRDRDSGNSKGFGFVEMEDKAAGEKAIEELDGSSVGGRNIRVNEARPRGERSSRPPRKNW